MEAAGTVVTEKTISSALCRHGLHARSPQKDFELLKKKQVEACLKFATEHLEKPVNNRENGADEMIRFWNRSKQVQGRCKVKTSEPVFLQ